MPDAHFEEVAELVKTLSPAEQQRLREMLDTGMVSPPTPPTEDEFEQELLREGILDHVPPPITDPTPYQEWNPIEVQGKPLSETIVEERR